MIVQNAAAAEAVIDRHPQSVGGGGGGSRSSGPCRSSTSRRYETFPLGYYLPTENKRKILGYQAVKRNLSWITPCVTSNELLNNACNQLV